MEYRPPKANPGTGGYSPSVRMIVVKTNLKIPPGRIMLLQDNAAPKIKKQKISRGQNNA
jgi:hypothetical protein